MNKTRRHELMREYRQDTLCTEINIACQDRPNMSDGNDRVDFFAEHTGERVWKRWPAGLKLVVGHTTYART